jgi:two-component system CheB/CheR fusion protein
LSKDIQQQKDAERQAREAVVRRDEFLAMLSHELRNPLGAVLNAAELMSRDEECHEASSLASGVILRQSRQMARLLDDLLDVSRVTQGKIEIRKKVVELGALVRDAHEAVRPEIDDRKHKLDLQLPDEPLYVEGDPARLLQILENLLGNSGKYTPTGGHIVASLRQQGSDAVISVQDNGEGIPPEMLHAIFELFVQGPKSLARTEGGMGIGLSLARVLAELHGGKLSVESPGKGQGSTFTVRLPLTEKRPAPSKFGSLPSVEGIRVLIIEDNDDSRATLEKILRLFGCKVTTAADGRAGFEAICRERPEVAVVDIGLPGIDGYEIARRVRSTLPGRSIRLIAATGYGRAEDRAAVMKAGFDAHVVKPMNPDELIRLLRE